MRVISVKDRKALQENERLAKENRTRVQNERVEQPKPSVISESEHTEETEKPKENAEETVQSKGSRTKKKVQ